MIGFMESIVWCVCIRSPSATASGNVVRAHYQVQILLFSTLFYSFLLFSTLFYSFLLFSTLLFSTLFYSFYSFLLLVLLLVLLLDFIIKNSEVLRGERVKWLRLSEQDFRFDRWSICRD